jgi:Flp pilus assembly protein TadG
MTGACAPRSRMPLARRISAETAGSQIVEFALSLPLLVVFVVGIFDFGGAVTLKQKLTNAAREGARVAASDPANDLSTFASSTASGIPASVSDAFQVVDNYLKSENISDCGLQSDTPAYSSGLAWVSTATAAPCATTSLVLTINRACTSPQTIGQGRTAYTEYVVATCVTIQYPYQWEYNKVAGLVGGLFTGPTSITTAAAAYNEN